MGQFESNAMLTMGIVAIAILVSLVFDGIKGDLSALLSKRVESAIRDIARRSLCREDAGQLVDWLEFELAEVRDRDGSGLGIGLLFLLYTMPLWVLYAHSKRGASRR